LGGYLPERVVTNDEISTSAGVTAEWIRERTGIVSRRFAAPDESIVSMAHRAGGRALDGAAITPDEVDLVILTSSTARRPIPGLAAQVGTALGLGDCGAFDVNAACAGFSYALSAASDVVRLGNAHNVLVVASERMSHWIGPAVPDTFAIFADGAGAAVVSRAEDHEIGPPVWGSDGGRHASLEVPDEETFLHMNGSRVYRWAVTTVPNAARLACKRAGVEIADVDWLVLHQANQRIIDVVATELSIPNDRTVSIIAESGNTSSASIPMALAQINVDGRAKRGDIALLVGFGAGLTYAAQIIRMP
jgi:3-oxoacyl-[acyl-carrier-protein] synthase-3